LPGQPIFYRVLNEQYAIMIARGWNVRQSGAGFVTRFQVRRSFLDRYQVHQAGGQTILEYWIPAERPRRPERQHRRQDRVDRRVPLTGDRIAARSWCLTITGISTR
jgi:hypothetical protein